MFCAVLVAAAAIRQLVLMLWDICSRQAGKLALRAGIVRFIFDDSQ